MNRVESVRDLWNTVSTDYVWDVVINNDAPMEAYLASRVGERKKSDLVFADFPAYVNSCVRMLSKPPVMDYVEWLLDKAYDESVPDEFPEPMKRFTKELVADKLQGHTVKNQDYYAFPDMEPCQFARCVLMVMNNTLLFEVDKLLAQMEYPVVLSGTLNKIYPAFYQTLEDEQIEVYSL